MANDKDQPASLFGLDPTLSEAEQRAAIHKLDADGNHIVDAHEALEAYKAGLRALHTPTGDKAKDDANRKQLQNAMVPCKGLNLQDPMNNMEFPLDTQTFAGLGDNASLKILAEEIKTYIAPSKVAQCGALKEVMSEDVKAPAAKAVPATGATKTPPR